MYFKKGPPKEWRHLTTCEAELLGLSKNWQIKIEEGPYKVATANCDVNAVEPKMVKFIKVPKNNPIVYMEPYKAFEYSKLLFEFWNKPRVRPRGF